MKKTKTIIIIILCLALVISFWIITLKLNLQKGFNFTPRSGLSFEQLRNEINEIINKSPLIKSEQDDQEKIDELTERLAEELKNTETANWQAYTNEEYGFEFKYPDEWNEPSSEGKEQIRFSLNSKDQKISIQGASIYNFVSTGSIEGNTNFVKERFKNNNIEIFEEIPIINGKCFYYVGYDKLYGDNHEAYVIGKNHIFILSMYLFQEKTDEIFLEAETLMKNFLSTFKFLE